MKRRIIHIVAKHSDWLSKDILKAYDEEGILPSLSQWKSLVHYMLLAIGVIFFVVGVIFFFAFNWDDIPKMTKLGLIQALIIIFSLLAAFGRWGKGVQEILLIGAVLLIGVLFAVFGQLYQTGANAYDFFLGWTMFSLLWVIARNSLVLWTLFLVLCNTTLILFFNQVQTHLRIDEIILLLFVLNGIVLISRILLQKVNFVSQNGKWFHYLLTLFVFGSLVTGTLYEIFDDGIALGFLGVLISFPLLHLNGHNQKDVFYLGILGFSSIILILSLIIRELKFDSFGIFLLISLFVIGMVGFLVQYLLKLNRTWYGKK